jgi:predicted transcriptional regulator
MSVKQRFTQRNATQRNLQQLAETCKRKQQRFTQRSTSQRNLQQLAETCKRKQQRFTQRNTTQLVTTCRHLKLS